jgi:replicative DNA helicase
MNSCQLEKIIISSLLNDGDYSRKVMPFTQPQYFSTNEASTVTQLILEYSEEYQSLPTKDALEVELENKKGLSSELFTNSRLLIETVFKADVVTAMLKLDKEWVLDKTEKHFRQQSCHMAVLNSINILEGEDKVLTPDAIPGILEEALNIHFDTDIGHDYFADAEERFEYYHRTDVRIPFLLNALNNVTNGGAVKKSLIVPVAPTGVGKSFFMTAWSAFLLKLGYNVLYITLEMSEEKIGERIDSNLMDIAINDLNTVPKDVFTNKINSLKSTHLGNLKIKEYPSSSFNALHLKGLLNELKAKNNFKPDIIMVDYLNLVSSSVLVNSSDTYNAVKNAARELRSIAMEFDLIVV